jgi:hypothetical protein
MLKTGPSVQTQTLPPTVFSTQHKHVPSPHAILFSSDTSQSIFRSPAYFAIAVIIG